ncbi:MAG: class II fumarate hydratase, partial [Ilumatobacter sp.]|nr:class II fumarate hydratase [Ilumatobacter sp.]
MTAVAPSTRTEHDSIGAIEIDATRLWGAQTERSLHNFPIGRDRYVWGREVIEAIGLVKRAAAAANLDAGVLDAERAGLIERAATDVVAGELDEHFPLVVFQTGSGTQTNMNANEVIANRANQLHGSPLGG